MTGDESKQRSPRPSELAPAVSDAPNIVWFRRDLRLADNPAWSEATHAHDAVLALFVLDPRLVGAAGPHRRQALFASLASLDGELAELGGHLHVRHGRPEEVVPRVMTDCGAHALWTNASISPWGRRRDELVAQAVDGTVYERWGNLVQQPGAVLTRAGRVSQVFTPFFKVWTRTPVPSVAAPTNPRVLADFGDGLPTDPSGDPPADDSWSRLEDFLDRVDDYDVDRDRLDRLTSGLSVDLKFGTLAASRVIDVVGTHTPGREAFVRQVAWRDWYAHLLHDRPELVTYAQRPAGDRVAWIDDQDGTEAWKQGRTGYPVVDAAMRCLRETGTMSGRARMLAASFLTKDLLVDWRVGERHFRHWLVDADTAQNVGNWQWVAGTGPDASPYFRVFNPITQSRKFDPTGAFIRRWVPELAALDDRAVHVPWEAAEEVLAAAGVALGVDYPRPIVDHAYARKRAISAHRQARAVGS
jgi:deoxyribodipyrimidine photo-lyase